MESTKMGDTAPSKRPDQRAGAFCGERMKLRALVRDPECIERFLRHQGL
jgi:hypothetical protein